MSAMDKTLHDVAIVARKVIMKLLPDRVPVTFVGADAVREMCEAIGHLGVRKPLVVTDAGLVKAGIVEQVTKQLEAAGLEPIVYDGVEPDPTFAQVGAGIARYRGEGCDCIVAVGGGSSMDAAKLMAAILGNDKPAEKLEGLLKVRKPTVPLFAIPTTAGTGSEVTVVAVISDTHTHTKKFFIDPKLIPSMAALDPTLMVGLPPAITAATGMDALTHAVESYLCSTSTAQTEAYALTSVRLVFANLPTAYKKGTDLAARKAMALASYYGGLAFTRTGVGYVHAIAHAFGAYYRTPHGLANAIVLPHVLEYSKDAARRRLAELADAVALGGNSDAEKADRFIEAVRNLESEVGIPPTLDALRRSDIPAIARQAVTEAHMDYPVPRYMDQSECERMLERMLSTEAVAA
ncbi:MAG: iron-containing alcohol dehydrogenase [Deltaproteobacteria bacterium]|nr:MAG: iron-containing alcohol dehydrogenase [Deltaproteobacteria bacterium]